VRASAERSHASKLSRQSKLLQYAQMLRYEGARSLVRRMQDRVDEARRRRSFVPVKLDRIAEFTSNPPLVLNFLPCPPAARFGGIPLQLIARLAEESRYRTVALMYPFRGRYRLELQDGVRRGSLEFEGEELSPLTMVDERFEAAVAQALKALRTHAIHFEGTARVPLESVAQLQQSRIKVLLSIHDFSLFCARPHLLEYPSMRFCDYSTDLERCRNCLGATWQVRPDTQATYREAGKRALAGAAAVIYPSQFMRRQYGELFRHTRVARECIIEPSVSLNVTDRIAKTGAVKHVAIVGAVTEPKGSRLIEETISLASRRIPGSLRWSAIGGGDVTVLRRLRAMGVAVEGYYRAGMLPGLLRRHEVDIAMMLSIVPESFGLTLSECWAAGVAVIAFDHGAVAERIAARGGGVVVKLAEGAPAIAQILEALVGGRQIPLLDPNQALPTPEAAAAAYGRLYSELGLSSI
jgi:glycosyltransferase involved in cell wall biosynthesis